MSNSRSTKWIGTGNWIAAISDDTLTVLDTVAELAKDGSAGGEANEPEATTDH